MYEFRLYLYISGETTNSVAGARSVKSLLNRELKGQYSFEVINVLDHPQRAENDNIVATPTLITVPKQRNVFIELNRLILKLFIKAHGWILYEVRKFLVILHDCLKSCERLR